MKVLLFTHEQDIDGMGSVVIGKIAFPNLTYVPCKTFEIDSNFKKYLDDKSIYDYDLIFVTDLCLHEPILSIINEDKILRNKVLVLDHHKTEIGNAKYDFVNVIIECSQGLSSGTYLFYEYLLKNNYLESRPVLDELVEWTRQYDTWDWVKHNNQKARMLHLLFEQIGYERYVQIMGRIVANNDSIVFSSEEMEIINDWENKFKEDSKNILDNMSVYVVNIDGRDYRVGYVFTEYKYRNDLNELVKANNVNDIDVIGMFFPNMNVASYRGVKDVDVSIVPTYFGGKGHKGAGTNPIDNERFKDVLDTVSFENVQIEREKVNKLVK